MGDAVMDDAKKSGGGAKKEVVRNRLKEYLDERGTRYSWLCQKVGYHQTTLNRIMRNEQEPSSRLMLKVAKVLGRPVEELFWIEDIEEVSPFESAPGE